MVVAVGPGGGQGAPGQAAGEAFPQGAYGGRGAAAPRAWPPASTHSWTASPPGRGLRGEPAGRGYGVSPRTSRSRRAHTNSAMPMKPFTVKNARFSRDRSCGFTIECS